MAKLRPVSSEDRFTLVEHLSELRTRIMASLAIFIVAFAIAYWQNGNILEIVNKPLEESQKVTAKTCTGKTNNDSQQSVCFERAVSKALRELSRWPSHRPPERQPRRRPAEVRGAGRHPRRAGPRADEHDPQARHPGRGGAVLPDHQRRDVRRAGAVAATAALPVVRVPDPGLHAPGTQDDRAAPPRACRSCSTAGWRSATSWRCHGPSTSSRTSTATTSTSWSRPRTTTSSRRCSWPGRA